MQSVHITTNNASFNPTRDGVYLIQLYVTKIVSELQQESGFPE
jgi:hypothetical protein